MNLLSGPINVLLPEAYSLNKPFSLYRRSGFFKLLAERMAAHGDWFQTLNNIFCYSCRSPLFSLIISSSNYISVSLFSHLTWLGLSITSKTRKRINSIKLRHSSGKSVYFSIRSDVINVHLRAKTNAGIRLTASSRNGDRVFSYAEFGS